MIEKYDSKKLDLNNKKLKIVQEYLTTNITQSELRNKYEIGMADFISTWINQFNIELYHLGFNQEIIDKRKLNSDKNKNIKLLKIIENHKDIMYIPTFTKSQRYSIIEEYLSSPISQSELSRKYKINWRGKISNWINNIEIELNFKKNSKDHQLNNKEINMLKLLEEYNKNKKTVRKFSHKFKEDVVNEYMSNSMTHKQLAKKHNLDGRLVSSWIQIHKNKASNSDQVDNTKSDKDIVYSEFLSKITKNKESKIKDLRLETEKLKPTKSDKDIGNNDFVSEITNNEESKIQDLKLEIEKLKLENKQKSEVLEYETLKSKAFSTLIDVAEKELKISIRKKFDVKQ